MCFSRSETGRGHLEMLKMEIDPAMCLKIQVGKTKRPIIKRLSWRKMHRLCEFQAIFCPEMHELRTNRRELAPARGFSGHRERVGRSGAREKCHPLTSARSDVAPTFRSALAELEFSATNAAACHDMLEKERVSHIHRIRKSQITQRKSQISRCPDPWTGNRSDDLCVQGYEVLKARNQMAMR
jgi:hypothetical protein